MKKIIFFILTGIISMNMLQSQNVPNGSFENWTIKTMFDQALTYNTTSSSVSYLISGISNVTKSAESHSGNYALRLETIKYGKDTISGVIMNGQTIKNKLRNAYPYTDRPATINLYAKYNVASKDTAFVYVTFNKLGQYLGAAVFKFYGIQPEYKLYTTPIYWIDWDKPVKQNPDTLNATIGSSGFGVKHSIPGSVLYVDDISLPNVSQAFPNGDFENWKPINIEEPDDWNTYNMYSLISGKITSTKTTDVYEGNYALKLENTVLYDGSKYDTIGYITNGKLISNKTDNFEGGKPINNYPDKIKGYYKFIPNGIDTAIVAAHITKYDSIKKKTIELGTAIIKLPPASTYSYFEMTSNYIGELKPDTLGIVFTAGNFSNNNYLGKPGSVLYIDNLSLDNKHFYNIAGQLTYMNSISSPIKNTKLYLRNSLSQRIDSTFTDTNGYYKFGRLIPGEYVVEPIIKDNWGGVDPGDALSANRNYIGLYNITDELIKSAANVNNDAAIDPGDALLINRRYIGMVNRFTNPDWLFEIKVIQIIDQNLSNNIKVICNGDINGSYTDF